MRRASGDNHYAAGFYFARFISHRDRGRAFDRECDFDVGMLMQGWPLSGPSRDDVGGEWRALGFAYELMRHSHKRQLLEIDETHAGNVEEVLQSSRADIFGRSTGDV